MKRVAAALGNTPAVCRKSYIHPLLCSAYLDGGLNFEAGAEGGTSGLRPDEAALLALMRESPAIPGSSPGSRRAQNPSGLPTTVV